MINFQILGNGNRKGRGSVDSVFIHFGFFITHQEITNR